MLTDRFCGVGDIDSIKKKLIQLKLSVKDYIMMPYYGNKIFDVDCIAKRGKLIEVAVRERQLKNPLMPTSTGHKIKIVKKIENYVKKLCGVFKVDGPADFDIVKDGHTQIIVYDIMGRQIKNLVGENMKAGYHTVSWNGTNNSGNNVSAGVYLCTLSTSSFTKTIKLLLLK